MYLLKKILSRFFFPVPLVVELLVLGFFLQRFSASRRMGKRLVIAGMLLLVVFGYNVGTEQALRSIERTFPPVTADVVSGLPALADIAVLGQGLADEPGLPANSRVHEVYLARILEAVRIHRLKPDSRILISVPGSVPVKDKRKFLHEMADIVGLEHETFVLLDGARDTADEQILVMKELRGTNLVVVSSASHLPRAMRMFDGAGINAVPAPCGYNILDPGKSPWSPLALFPNARNLLAAENAVYEIMGNLWVKVRGHGAEGKCRSLENEGPASATGIQKAERRDEADAAHRPRESSPGMAETEPNLRR